MIFFCEIKILGRGRSLKAIVKNLQSLLYVSDTLPSPLILLVLQLKQHKSIPAEAFIRIIFKLIKTLLLGISSVQYGTDLKAV